MSSIVKSYWRSLLRGTRTLAQVPKALQADVAALAKKDLDAGTLDQETYDSLMGAQT